MNAYQFFFEENGKRPFWCWKHRWGNTRFLIFEFAPPTKPPPYYGEPRALLEVWKRSEGVWRLGEDTGYGRSFGTYNWLFAPYKEDQAPPESPLVLVK